jgi:hypothetical protein
MSGITQIVGNEDNGTSRTVYVNSSNALKTFSITDDAIVTDNSPVTLESQKGIALMGFAGTQSVNANDACMLACSTAGRLEVDVISTSGATEAKQDEISAKLPATLGKKENAASMSVCLSSTAGEYDLSARTTIGTPSTSTKLLCDTDGHLQVDVLTLPSVAVTGNVACTHVSLPLPSGAATETTLDEISAKLPATLGKQVNAASMSVCRSSTDGEYDLSARTTIGTPSTSTKLLCDTNGHLQVDVLTLPSVAVTGNVACTHVSLPLPSGAATSALQGDIQTAVQVLSTAQTIVSTQMLFGSGNLVANNLVESSSNNVEFKNNGRDYFSLFITAENTTWYGYLEYSYDETTWWPEVINYPVIINNESPFSSTYNARLFKHGKYVRVKIENTTAGVPGETNAFVVHIVQ